MKPLAGRARKMAAINLVPKIIRYCQHDNYVKTDLAYLIYSEQHSTEGSVQYEDSQKY